ncbi:MAG: hypothetical protein ACE5GT_03585 [Rhodospirillales bacterium]
MRPAPRFAPFGLFVLAAAIALAAGLAPGSALAAPQIVAAVPTKGPIAFTCDGEACWAEVSTICLQRTRTTPSVGARYRIHGPDRTAVAVTGRRANGGAVALAPGVLDVTALRGQVAFRFSVPAGFLTRHGLEGITVEIGRLAALVPVAEAGDDRPQTSADVALVLRQAGATGGYWAAKNAETVALARVTGRVINRLPTAGAVSAAEERALWEKAAAPEEGLSGDARAWSRVLVGHCRNNASAPGGYPMRRCLGSVHDRFMHDLNVDYWKALKPQS